MSSCKDDDDNILQPIVTSTSPLDNAEGNARNITISATFSIEMDASTINANTFMLKQGTTSIPGTVEYAGETATFTPLGTLSALTDYTVTITTSAKSTNGKALANNHMWTFSTGGSSEGISAVALGAAGNYVILAKTAVNNNPTSAITGDIGLSPAATSYIVGFTLTDATGYATSDQITGKVHAADMADPTPINLTTAVENMITAYNDAAGRTLPDFIDLASGSIGGLTLSPGLYKWTNTVTISSDVTISGNSTDVWIFQIAENITVSSAANLILSGGAQAKNIYWQVAGQATFGTTSHFEGVILSMTGITFQTGASLNGRALAQTAVVLDGNAVTLP
ncbi:ice-binding family protein [Perlabentimonas gracilis]|uniref:ice-binding family protein n=1 Tax=Perlabentimonas gracilis TaxID=2715279 RepID=UPI001C6368CC|nr:ice-binding family protein [Perlabentimonas gracilis]